MGCGVSGVGSGELALDVEVAQLSPSILSYSFKKSKMNGCESCDVRENIVTSEGRRG